MSVDPYALCPCGSGKKIKFCCADLKPQIEKFQRMLQGDQPQAGLRFIEDLCAKHPDRISLLCLKSGVQMQLRQTEAARASVEQVLAREPNNPMANAHLAILCAIDEDGRSAIEPIHRALAVSSGEIPSQVVEALGAVGQALLAQGEVFAARAHLSWQALMAGKDDRRSSEMLARIYAASEVPLLLKEDLPIVSCPEGAPYRVAFAEAEQAYRQGDWRGSEAKFSALAVSASDAPAVWRNLISLRASLADQEGLLAALRTYASLDVSPDEAIEAEATAQLIDPAALGEPLDIVLRTFEVSDQTELETTLRANPRFSLSPVDPNAYAESEEPAPRHMVWILDRPEVEASDELTFEQVPLALARGYLFGRETDRQSRFELVGPCDESLVEAQSVLQEVAGQWLSEPAEDEVVGATSVVRTAMSWTWRIPEQTPADQRRQLTAAKRRDTLLRAWPTQPLPVLDGKSPQEATLEPALQTQLLAAILVLEQSFADADDTIDFNQLRRQLELPEAGPIDPNELAGQPVTLAQTARLALDKTSDEVLLEAYDRAVLCGADRAIKHLAPELLNREGVEGRFNKAELCGLLAEQATDAEQALVYLEQARTYAEAAGQSSAPWDLAELAVHIDRGNAPAAQQMLQHLQQDHINEPGVGERLMQMLMAAGVIGPDGTPAGPPSGEAVGLAGAGAPPADDGKIWTPESETPGEAKGKIWTPS